MPLGYREERRDAGTYTDKSIPRIIETAVTATTVPFEPSVSTYVGRGLRVRKESHNFKITKHATTRRRGRLASACDEPTRNQIRSTNDAPDENA